MCFETMHWNRGVVVVLESKSKLETNKNAWAEPSKTCAMMNTSKKKTPKMDKDEEHHTCINYLNALLKVDFFPPYFY